jgi:hypothetical protein
MKHFPTAPAHPERICWGCEKLCPAHDLACGNGSEREMHPIELFGPDWPSLLPGHHAADACSADACSADAKTADAKTELETKQVPPV